MKVMHTWFGRWPGVAIAWSGVSMDEVSLDAPRAQEYAVRLQYYRDIKNYQEADLLRGKIQSLGGVVRSTKDYTLVADSLPINFTHIPDFSGFSSYVEPSEVGGRKILETVYEPDWVSGIPTVYSYKVANWKDHPNLEVARKMGLPDTIWTEAGQMTIEKSTSIYWLFEQMDHVERKAAEILLAKTEESLVEKYSRQYLQEQHSWH